MPITGYKVYRNGTLVASPAASPYTDLGLTNGVTYSYQVSAVNEIGEGPKSVAVTATPSAVVPPPVGKVAHVDPSITVSQFITVCRDSTLDVVEMAAGVYHGGGSFWRMSPSLGVSRSASKPLTILANGIVNFDGVGSPASDYGDQVFNLNGCSYIIFDGRQGQFLFTDYFIGQTGIFSMGGCSNISIYNIKGRKCVAGGTSNGSSSHLAYLSSTPRTILFDGIDFADCQPSDMTRSGALGGLNGIHSYNSGSGSGGAQGLTVRNATFEGMDWAVVLRDSTTGVLIDNLVATNCGHSVTAALDLAGGTGTIKNSRSASSSGTPIIWGNVTDGGGNGPWA